ncbi:MAG TPA: FAD-binding protein, partial [Vicinamibacterales bacterium]|nr:FAD-binding protein [Vicinamibacterales bacterium]
MTLPPGVSESAFRAAIREFTAALGAEQVFTSEEDLALYRDAYTPYRGMPDKEIVASAAVAPVSVEQVQSVVRIANKHRVPLFATSTGRNLGYGGAAPTLSGS